MIKQSKPGIPDLFLLFSAVVLLSIGLIMVMSSSSLFSFRATDNSYHLFYKQLNWAFLGLFVAGIVVFIPYPFWKKLSGLSLVVAIVLLLMVEFSAMSTTIKGSARWLNIGGISIQPSEIAKLALVLFLSHILNRYPVRRIRDLWIALPVIGIIVLLVYKQPDLGTTIVILIACGVMLLMTELPTRYFAIALPIIGVAGLYMVRRTVYQWNRILGWLYPWEYASTHGYQIVNAQIAFGSGGLFGIGIGRSVQGSYLPESYTDTIFAVIGEEFGFFGTSLVLLLYALLISRGYQISRQCPDRFGRFLGFGITSILAIQISINLGVVTGLFPVTGITLPLISYGGSSLLMTMVEIGILLNISRYRMDS